MSCYLYPMIRKLTDVVILIAFVFVLASCTGKKETNVQEQKNNATRVSIAEIESGIKTFIQKKTDENGGYFQVNDQGQGLSHEAGARPYRIPG